MSLLLRSHVLCNRCICSHLICRHFICSCLICRRCICSCLICRRFICSCFICRRFICSCFICRHFICSCLIFRHFICNSFICTHTSCVCVCVCARSVFVCALCLAHGASQVRCFGRLLACAATPKQQHKPPAQPAPQPQHEDKITSDNRCRAIAPSSTI